MPPDPQRICMGQVYSIRLPSASHSSVKVPFVPSIVERVSGSGGRAGKPFRIVQRITSALAPPLPPAELPAAPPSLTPPAPEPPEAPGAPALAPPTPAPPLELAPPELAPPPPAPAIGV